MVEVNKSSGILCTGNSKLYDKGEGTGWTFQFLSKVCGSFLGVQHVLNVPQIFDPDLSHKHYFVHGEMTPRNLKVIQADNDFLACRFNSTGLYQHFKQPIQTTQTTLGKDTKWVQEKQWQCLQHYWRAKSKLALGQFSTGLISADLETICIVYLCFGPFQGHTYSKSLQRYKALSPFDGRLV